MRSLILLFIVLSTNLYSQGTWTQVTNLPPDTSGGAMLLLSDGTIMCKTQTGGTGMGSIGTVWNKLTPDASGSYINGTWSVLAPMANSRLYFSSQVLKDGRIYVAGGEYGTGGALAEMYNPLTNTWSAIPAPGGTISDANSEILPDGQVIQAMVNGTLKTTKIYNPSTNTYSAGPSSLGIHNESAWVKLADNSILFVDRNATTSERYIPSLNQFTADATVPVSLYDPFGLETGAAVLLPNGKAFFLGSKGKTAIYTPSGNNSPGSWVAGADIPNFNGTPDAMMAIMSDGKVMCVVSPTPTSANHFPSPTSFYEYDYLTNTYLQIPAPYNGMTINAPCYIFNLINLPNGQLMLSEQDSKKYYIYTPAGSQLAAGQPTIGNIIQSGCTNFTITGTLFNGISEGSCYGDDWQNATNYPIVQLKNGSNVYYARTFNWNRTAVMTGNLPDTTQFTLPVNLPHLTYSLVVIANGIHSDPVSFTPFPILTNSTLPTQVCTNSNFTYTPSGPIAGSSFSWTRAAVAGISNTAITNQQPGSINEVLYNTTPGPVNVIYTYSINAPTGCSATQNITLAVNPLPTVGISGTSTICSGDSDVLTANGASTYLWDNNSTNINITVNPTTNTTYTVTGTDANNCSNTQQFAVTVNPTPVLSITGNTAVCHGDSIQLTANGGSNYNWSNSATTNTIMVNPSVNTTYSVSSTNAFGCTGVDSVQITVNDCTGLKEIGSSFNTNIKAYPNPANNYVNISFTSAQGGNYHLTLMNTLGETLLVKQDDAKKGYNTIKLTIENIPTGIYLICINRDGNVYQTKINVN